MEAIDPPKFKEGDFVIWTNEYGVDLGVRQVVQVDPPDKWSNRYYLEPTDTPWMYVREKQLELAPADYATF